MRRPILIAAALAAFFLGGCASTVSPLYTKTDAVTDAALVGTWVGGDNDDHGTVGIEKMKDASYQVSVHDAKSGDDSLYQAHLVKLGSASFADLLLTHYRHDGKDVDFPAGVVALHEIVKYQVTSDELSFSTIDGDALDKSAKQPGFSLQLRDTTQPGGDTVILSTTKDLRRYFSAHPAAIFGNVEHLRRQH
jgi:hypothetical protein